MINANADALGIIFPNSYDSLVPELTNERLMASIPFGSRYRMVDFVLSSMVNSGIDNVSLIVKKNYHSLLDHLGTGREWDLTRKNGGLNIVPPFAQKNIKVYNGRVEAVASIIKFLSDQKEKYSVLSDAHCAFNIDFNQLIEAHKAQNADVTVAYMRREIPEGLLQMNADYNDFYYTLRTDGDWVKSILINSKEDGIQNLSMNVYVMEREFLINQIEQAYTRGYSYFERDILAPQLDKLKLYGYCYDGYVAYINNMKSYFDENMKLLEEENASALFSGNSIYTKIRDDNPTRYLPGAKASNVMVADGCVIEGEVENSILFRGVKVAKGAKIKNCILMQDTVVGENATIEYTITDKNVTLTSGKDMKGTDTFPVYVAKGQIV